MIMLSASELKETANQINKDLYLLEKVIHNNNEIAQNYETKHTASSSATNVKTSTTKMRHRMTTALLGTTLGISIILFEKLLINK